MGYSHLAPNTSAATAAVQSAHQGVAQSYQNIGKSISDGINNTIEQHRKGQEHSQAMTHRDAEHGQKIRHNEQTHEDNLKTAEVNRNKVKAETAYTNAMRKIQEKNPQHVINSAVTDKLNANRGQTKNEIASVIVHGRQPNDPYSSTLAQSSLVGMR